MTKNQNDISYKLRKIKLQRLIPYYDKLKTDAVKTQRWVEASNYRSLQLEYMDQLREIRIKELKLGL